MLNTCISSRRTLKIIKKVLVQGKFSYLQNRKLSTVKQCKYALNYATIYRDIKEKTELHCHIEKENRSMQDSSDISVCQLGIPVLPLISPSQ